MLLLLLDTLHLYIILLKANMYIYDVFIRISTSIFPLFRAVKMFIWNIQGRLQSVKMLG